MIKIENLTFRYPDGTEALKEIQLRIKKGEFVALLGRNGSGKSTLLKHLNGLLQPSEGKVFVKGLDSSDNSNLLKIRQRVGLVFQNPITQFVGTTLEEDVAFGPENLGLPSAEIRKRVDWALAEVGLEAYKTRAPKTLSGGEQQGAALASVLALQPECLALDEPTSMLDPESRALFLRTLNKLWKKGQTLVYGTQRLEEILAADRVIVMDRGKIVRQGKPKEVLKAANTSTSGSEPGLKTFGLKLPPLIELLNGLEAEGFFLDWKKIISNESLAEEIWASLSKT